MQPAGPKPRGALRRWVVLHGRSEPEQPEAPAPVRRPEPDVPRRPEVVDRSPSVEELEAEDRYQRSRLALYRQRIIAGKPTTPRRLREIERAMEGARERLRRARRRPADTH
jgi:hypothetical protein